MIFFLFADHLHKLPKPSRPHTLIHIDRGQTHHSMLCRESRIPVGGGGDGIRQNLGARWPQGSPRRAPRNGQRNRPKDMTRTATLNHLLCQDVRLDVLGVEAVAELLDARRDFVEGHWLSVSVSLLDKH